MKRATLGSRTGDDSITEHKHVSTLPVLPRPHACIDTSGVSGTFTLETYYLNFIVYELYAQKCLKYKKSQYWRPSQSA